MNVRFPPPVYKLDVTNVAHVANGTNPTATPPHLFVAYLFALQDVLSNFFGGLMLLLAEPFIPGDMVTFQRGGVK